MKRSADGEGDPDGPFNPAGGVDFEHEGGLGRAGVGDGVQFPTRDRDGVPGAELSSSAASAEPDRSSEDLEALAWWTFARLDIDRVRRARLQPDVRAALRDFVRENARFFDAAGQQGRSILKRRAQIPPPPLS